jgi:hypothetical protein
MNSCFVLVTTTPRSKNLLVKTLFDLSNAGWNDYAVINDQRRIGPTAAWMRALELCLSYDRDYYLIVQDDVTFPKRLRHYFEYTIPNDWEIASLFCARSEEKPLTLGWYRARIRFGALAFAMRSYFAPALFQAMCDLGLYDPDPRQTIFYEDRNVVPIDQWKLGGEHHIFSKLQHIDSHVGFWATRANKIAYNHNPSLSAHTGHDSSTIGHSHRENLQDYIGDIDLFKWNEKIKSNILL